MCGNSFHDSLRQMEGHRGDEAARPQGPRHTYSARGAYLPGLSHVAKGRTDIPQVLPRKALTLFQMRKMSRPSIYPDGFVHVLWWTPRKYPHRSPTSGREK